MKSEFAPNTSSTPKLLIVDDTKGVRQMLIRILHSERSYELDEASNGAEAKEKLLNDNYDLVITDLNMPGMSGLQLMAWALENRPGATWIILSGFGTFETAIEAIHLGAFDFVPKPIESRTGFRITVRNALAQKRLRDEMNRLNAELIHANELLHERVGQLESACTLLGDQAEVIAEDLQRAERIQCALLPNRVPEVKGVAAAAVYRPSQTIGGDLYDIFKLSEHRVAFVIADAAGHGVSAAMLSVLFKTRLQQLIGGDTPEHPAILLQRLNEYLFDECASPGLFITASYGVIDVQTGDLFFASAGHPPMLLHRANGKVEMLYHTGPALGLDREAKYAENRIRFDPGDQVLCYTDGLCEGWTDKTRLPAERLTDVLSDIDLQSKDSLLSILSKANEARGDRPAADDVTLLLVSSGELESSLDNVSPQRSSLATLSKNEATPASIMVGADDAGTVISIEGSGTWTHSATFFERAKVAVNEDQPLSIDLSCCSYLDSTFLGTIHEVITIADCRCSSVNLQGVVPQVLDEFCELGMARVLGHVSSEPRPLPTHMEALERAGEGEESSNQNRLLRAHEALASLNEENRSEFQNLIEALRQERLRSQELESQAH
jgi:sigma-B regulation protein RsbU (phosphoserine phosphatase)